MKSLNIKDIDALEGKRIKENESFFFHCHQGLTCFNKCCRNLNLFLYPYDVIRLKHALGISSDAFLDIHADFVLRPGNYFPAVLLRMREDEEKTCPFLTDSGCSVYKDRPDACRTFPIEQGLMLGENSSDSKLIHFFRPPDFCLGQHENREMTIKSWIVDQGAAKHNKMTQKWSALNSLFHQDPFDGKGAEGPKGKMAFMSTYNIDKFREFVFNSSFLKRYKVKNAVLKSLKKDDAALMLFGFSWVKLYLWGIPSKDLKTR